MADFKILRQDFAKLKDVWIENDAYPSEHKDQSLYNLQYLFKFTTENLHCKQQCDLPQL
jgi:hypothetical protein